jgi:hypothetical protein
VRASSHFLEAVYNVRSRTRRQACGVGCLALRHIMDRWRSPPSQKTPDEVISPPAIVTKDR